MDFSKKVEDIVLLSSGNGKASVFGVAGGVSYRLSLCSSTLGSTIIGWVENFGCRAFIKLGKVSIIIGNTSSLKITNITELIDYLIFLRRNRDSNPGYNELYDRLAIYCFRPLSHFSCVEN